MHPTHARTTWLGGGFLRGAAFGDPVTHAIRYVGPATGSSSAGIGVAPAVTAAGARTALDARRDEPGLHWASWGIDPRTWELMTFTLHTHRPDARGGELHDVPHLSMPEVDGLGRQRG